MHAGVNGIVINDAILTGSDITLKICNPLAQLKAPWKSVYITNLEITGLKSGLYKVSLNGNIGKSFTNEQLKNLTLIN